MSDGKNTFVSPVGVYGSFLRVGVDLPNEGCDYKFSSDKEIDGALGVTCYDKWCFEMGRLSLSESRSIREAKKNRTLRLNK